MTMEEKETSNKFGEFLKSYRNEQKKMNLREFADLIGISFSHLSKIERGEHSPSRSTIEMIAKALYLDEDKLLLLAGYVSDSYSFGLDTLFPEMDDDEKEVRRKASIVDKIKNEFPDADLMFNDLASFTADDMQDVYDYIKFKKSQKE